MAVPLELCDELAFFEGVRHPVAPHAPGGHGPGKAEAHAAARLAEAAPVARQDGLHHAGYVGILKTQETFWSVF